MLPFGTVNVAIAETAIQKGMKIALFTGMGASIVVFFHSYLALSFYNLLANNPELERSIIMWCIPIFFIIGLYYIFKKNNKKPKPRKKGATAIGMAKGFMLSSLNLIPIPWYVFIGGYLHNAGQIKLAPEFIAAFSCGVIFGSFAIFALYAKLGQYIRNKSEKLSGYASKIVGVIFIVIAISQSLRYYW
jgi:threonine/homoserine/homoserine lactone efflux protein